MGAVRTHAQVIDATRKGAISRFINHSCGPNCETQKWTIDGVQRIGIFTVEPVAKGTELCFDYKFKWFPGCVAPRPKSSPCSGARQTGTHVGGARQTARVRVKAQKCFCGSPKCTGFIGDAKNGAGTKEKDDGDDGKALALGGAVCAVLKPVCIWHRSHGAGRRRHCCCSRCSGGPGARRRRRRQRRPG
jgi:hypothetical protein